MWKINTMLHSKKQGIWSRTLVLLLTTTFQLKLLQAPLQLLQALCGGAMAMVCGARSHRRYTSMLCHCYATARPCHAVLCLPCH